MSHVNRAGTVESLERQANFWRQVRASARTKLTGYRAVELTARRSYPQKMMTAWMGKGAYRGGVDASTSPAKERYAVTGDNVINLAQPGTFSGSLTEIPRNGARTLLEQSMEVEILHHLVSRCFKSTARWRYPHSR